MFPALLWVTPWVDHSSFTHSVKTFFEGIPRTGVQSLKMHLIAPWLTGVWIKITRQHVRLVSYQQLSSHKERTTATTRSPSPSKPENAGALLKYDTQRNPAAACTANHPPSQASSTVCAPMLLTLSSTDLVSEEEGRCTPQLEHPQLEHCPLQLGHDEQEQPPGMLASGLTLYLVEWAWICWTLKKYLLNLYLFVF